MGLFSSITSSISKALNYISSPLSQPLTFITQGPTAAANAVAVSRSKISTGQESGVAKIATIIGTTALVGGAILAAAPAAATGSAGIAARTVATALIPKTITQGVITAAAIPVVYGVVKANPTAAQSVIEKAPSGLSNFGANVGNLISDPSLSNVGNIYKENPVIAGAATAGIASVLLGGAGLAANTIATYTNSRATKENTQAGSGDSTNLGSTAAPIYVINQLPEAAAAISAPVADQTSTIKKSVPKKAVKKKSTKKKAKPKKKAKKKKKTTKKKKAKKKK